ncbi:MAG: hypothetical protein J0L86_10400 [Flavobacteriales bacterium]|nr:hypothetical protein [Flavobacteriales bacterium]
MRSRRRQLTLFISDKSEIEKVRIQFNPEQYKLIDAHVTLCREDEIENWDAILNNIKSIHLNQAIAISFTSPITFDNGKGVLLPTDDSFEYNNLRKLVLGVDAPRNHQAHITLMHPRNSMCTPEIFKQIQQYQFPEQLFFDSIHLIEQENEGKWQVLAKFELLN